MVGVLGIVVLWAVAGLVLVMTGGYDSMPFWFQFGAGGSLFALFGLASYMARLRNEDDG